ACELTGWTDPRSVEALAAAHAEAGQFAEAVRWQKAALESPGYEGQAGPVVRERLRLYEAGRPYRFPQPGRPEEPGSEPDSPPGREWVAPVVGGSAVVILTVALGLYL